MATDQQITSLSEAAVELGTRPLVIGELVRSLGIQPKPVPRNGNAKGLDPSDMKRLRRALGKEETSPASQAVR